MDGEVTSWSLIFINETLHFGSQMDHSLTNLNQIHHYSIDVPDNPFDKVQDFGLDHPDLTTEDSTVYFEICVPFDKKLYSFMHTELTNDEEWDPTGMDLKQF
eukprot:CCRYP_004991-RA/>CCRYP_004991-RA protein AED:0.48 eAED:0.48 QI:0/0/0/1/0/0/2/0/101